MISYAQNFEDVILWRALNGIPKGFYIDIGAQDPILDSVSRHFYEAGWRGVHVEPTATYAAKLRKDRPDEEVLQCAVGAAGGAMRFFEIPDTGLSTGVEAIAREHEAAGFRVEETSAPVRTLAEVFGDYPDRDIHWMKIDCEGMEHDILASWGDSPARPWILVVESTVPGTRTASYAQWEPELLHRGYAFVYDDGLNRFYVSDTQAQLKAAFGPGPNCFDDFTIAPVSYMFHAADREIAAKQGELARLKARVDAESEIGTADLADALEAERRSVSMSAKLVDALERRLADSQAAAGALRAELAVAKARVAELRTAADHWHGRVAALETSTSWRLTAPVRWIRRALLRVAPPKPAPAAPAATVATPAKRPALRDRVRRPVREQSDLMARTEQIFTELRGGAACAERQG